MRILGPLQVVDGGRELPVGSGRQRALLLVLHLQGGETVSTDRLIDDLWGERPPPSAAKILQGYVSQLRRALPDGAIVTHPSGYALQGITSDAAEFERLLDNARSMPPRERSRTLASGLALWRGSAFADVEYEQWAAGEIRRLEDLRLLALEDLMAAKLEQGAHRGAVAELEALVREHPLRERLRAELMLALYRSGRQAEALEVFTNARTTLVEQLGIEPGPELRELQQQILAQDPVLGSTPLPLVEAVRRAPWLVLAGGLLLAGAAIAAGVLVTTGSSGRLLLATPNSLAEIDPTSNKLTHVIDVGQAPTSVAVGDDAVWALNSGEETLSRIDPRAGVVRDRIGAGSEPVDIALGAGAVWIADSAGILRRVVPATGLTETVRIPGALGANPLGEASWVASDPSGAVWATNGTTLSRVEPSPQLAFAASNVDCCGPIALGDGSVWTTDATGVLRFDARTGARQARVPIPALTNSSVTNALAVGAGSVWVGLTDANTVWRIDLRTNQLIATIVVGDHPSGIALSPGAVWVASADGTVSRIDPRAAQGLGRVVQTIRTGGTPSGITFGDGVVWVAID